MITLRTLREDGTDEDMVVFRADDWVRLKNAIRTAQAVLNGNVKYIGSSDAVVKLETALHEMDPGEATKAEERDMSNITERIENDFTYHAPKPGQDVKYKEIRSKAKELALLIMLDCPESREQSLAITKLEECVMWANASIARNE